MNTPTLTPSRTPQPPPWSRDTSSSTRYVEARGPWSAVVEAGDVLTIVDL